MSTASPPQSPVTTSDEPTSRSVKSPSYIPPEHAASHPDSASSIQPLASPTPPVSASSPTTANTSPVTSEMSRIQPSITSQDLATATISIDSNLSCLTSPEPATSLRRDQPVKIQSHDSGIVDPVSVPLKSRQSITPSFSFPGASKPTTTYGRVFPDSAISNCMLTTASSTDSIFTTSERMPNVYINGLPANFPEQDLFALTRPFGDIKSVRTFTRHVSEKPTEGDTSFSRSRGYGFVLFHDVDSAQRCIEGLRMYRNLHPSFSKQAHRIPGTEYAQHTTAQSTDQDDTTFKSRMDRLKDQSSTNLYIEGLPMSTDEESLAALMSPHKIKSSRFFKTKLSNPPRIIAFVRLETRTAAQEIIDRLHGRMVRGWNDPGCRISVRFADSAEQRELRRAERTLKNGEQSPSRLTIAQAALLNLRGQEYQANVREVTGGKSQRVANPHSDSQLVTFIPSSDPGLLPTPRSLPSELCYPFRESPLLSSSELQVSSEMDNILQSIQNNALLDGTMRSSATDNERLMTQQAHLRALASAALVSPNPPMALPRGHAQARNGFTPAEKIILEAHAQRLQLQTQIPYSPPALEPMPSSRKSNPKIRSLDPVTSRERFPVSGFSGKAMFSPETLPTISEDDFHAMGHPPQKFVPSSHEFKGLVSSPLSMPTAASTIFVRPPNRAVNIVAPPPGYEEPGKRTKGHQQHTERSVRQSSLPSESKSRSSLSQASTFPNDISNNINDNNSNTSTISRDHHTYMYSHGDAQGYSEQEKAPHFGSSHETQPYSRISTQLVGEQRCAIREGPKSPSIVSPALTYSSRTPSTLSPATPFFGSFSGGQDAFEVMTMENEDVAERKLKAKLANK